VSTVVKSEFTQPKDNILYENVEKNLICTAKKIPFMCFQTRNCAASPTLVYSS
jgi:hypothetical protein